MNIKKVADYKNKLKGRMYVLGNGPSLNDTDLPELIEGGARIFGTNRIYLANITPDYYACVNPLVLSQFAHEILQLDCIKFLPASFIEEVKGSKDTRGTFVPIDTTLNFPVFKTDLTEPIWEGYTVTYVALQIVYYMGIEEVVLLGIDHDYGSDSKRPNLEAVATGEDKNHFHPDYFSEGTRWNYPDLNRSELAYSLAKAAYEANGRYIYNCSTRTKLGVFNMKRLSDLDNHGWKKRVTAIVSAYNAKMFLEGCLEDLANQTEQPEIVVVCRKNEIEDEIAQSAEMELTIVTTANVPTVYAAWNLGIEAATCKYLTSANTDDRHHPKAMEIQADILDARPDIDLVYYDQYITWEPNQTFKEFLTENEGKHIKPGRTEGEPGFFCWNDYSLETMSLGCYMGPQPMWRADLHKVYGGFNERFFSAGDYDFWLRIAKDRNMLHIPYALGLYLARPDGIELSDPETSFKESVMAISNHQYPKGVNYDIFNGAYIKVSIDGRYVITPVQDFSAGITNFIEQLNEYEE